MSIFTNGIFSRPVIGGADTKANRAKAAVGFTQVFTTLLANEMRKAMGGSEKGPMGIGGGTTGNIYGSFFDQAMGATLAHSKAMKPLSDIIERGLSAPTHPVASALGGPGSRHTGNSGDGIVRVSYSGAGDTSKMVDPATTLRHLETDLNLPTDSRGPVLMPPEPSAMAPVLPPPSPVKG